MSECVDPVLLRIKDTLPVFKELFAEAAFGVSDKEKYLLYLSSKSVPFEIAPGTPLKPGTAIVRAMMERKRIVFRGDPATFGFPYIATAIPISNDRGEIVGAVVTTQAVDLQDNIRDIANTLNSSLSLMSNTSEQLSARSQEITGVSSELSKTYQSSMVKFQDTDQMLAVIRNVAGQTNLLGVNAAIEAARVGDLGRGFEVVATEIRKLSVSTSESVKQTARIIATIQEDNIQNGKQISHLTTAIGQTAEAVGRLANAVHETSTLAEKLNALADRLSARA